MYMDHTTICSTIYQLSIYSSLKNHRLRMLQWNSIFRKTKTKGRTSKREWKEKNTQNMLRHTLRNASAMSVTDLLLGILVSWERKNTKLKGNQERSSQAVHKRDVRTKKINRHAQISAIFASSTIGIE